MSPHIEEFKRLRKQITELESLADVHLLKQAKVVGITTTGTYHRYSNTHVMSCQITLVHQSVLFHLSGMFDV